MNTDELELLGLQTAIYIYIYRNVLYTREVVAKADVYTVYIIMYMHYIVTVILVYTMVIILDTRAGGTGDNSLTDCGSDGNLNT